MVAIVARFDLSPQLQINTADCATLYEHRKNGLWYSLKSNCETMEVEVGIRLWLSIALGLGLA